MNPQGSDMTSSKMQATIVHVTVEQGREGLFYGTCPELKGLFVAEHTKEAAWDAVPIAIQAMYEACGENVIVISATTQNDNVRPWVATRVPTVEALLAANHARLEGR